MTNAPAPGWYKDPEAAERLRYWDGAQWTEHIAGVPQAPTTYGAPVPPSSPYQPAIPQHATLFNNPYQKPPRTPRQAIEGALSGAERVQAAMLDAAVVIPFLLVGFFGARVLAWISGDHAAENHAYRGAALVLALVLGIGFVFWNFVIREITLGTTAMSGRRKSVAEESTPS